MDGFSMSGVSFNDKIWCFIEGDKIFQTDMTGAKKEIGKTTSSYVEIETTLSNYHEKLQELVKLAHVDTKAEEYYLALKELDNKLNPKDVKDEQIEQLQGMMLQLAQILKETQNEVRGLKNGLKQDSTISVSNVSKCKPKRSIKPSTASDKGSIGQSE